MSVEGKKDFEIKIRLNITDFVCDPDVITKILELTPDRTWLVGEAVIPEASNVHKQNGWSIDSPLSSVANKVDNQIDALKELLLGKVEKFGELPEGVYVEISCVVYAHTYFPDIFFSNENISFLNRINACIDIDIFDLIE